MWIASSSPKSPITLDRVTDTLAFLNISNDNTVLTTPRTKSYILNNLSGDATVRVRTPPSNYNVYNIGYNYPLNWNSKDVNVTLDPSTMMTISGTTYTTSTVSTSMMEGVSTLTLSPEPNSTIKVSVSITTIVLIPVNLKEGSVVHISVANPNTKVKSSTGQVISSQGYNFSLTYSNGRFNVTSKGSNANVNYRVEGTNKLTLNMLNNSVLYLRNSGKLNITLKDVLGDNQSYAVINNTNNNQSLTYGNNLKLTVTPQQIVAITKNKSSYSVEKGSILD